jgi:Thiamine monophosphate synthase
VSESVSQRRFPRLYPILDASTLAAHAIEVTDFAAELREAGVELLQYRDKTSEPQRVLRVAASLRIVFAGAECRLLLNDRADLAVLAGWDGVHVGQEDLTPEDARTVVGSMGWGFDAYGGSGSRGESELRGLRCGRSGVCHGDEAGCRAGNRIGGCEAGADADEEANRGDRWDYARKCAKRHRGGGRFGGGD